MEQMFFFYRRAATTPMAARPKLPATLAAPAVLAVGDEVDALLVLLAVLMRC